MFNLVTRFQTIGNQLLTTSMVVLAIVVVITFAQLYLDNAWGLETSISSIKPTTNIKYSFNYGSVNRKPKENSRLQFDLDADLTPLFNWNTKQIFVYLTAEYDGKSEGSSNRVTYWDKIITSKDDAVLSLKGAKAKYSVWDVEKSFRGREANVRLEWNVQPYIGPLVYGETGNAVFQFAEPKEKKENKEKKKREE